MSNDSLQLAANAACFVVFAYLLRQSLRAMALAAFSAKVESIRDVLAEIRRNRDGVTG